MSPLGASTTKLFEHMPDGSIKPYPNEQMAAGPNSKIKSLIAARISDDGIAWILDMTDHRFYGWDISKDELVKEIQLPKEVLVDHSFLQDYALDQKRNRAIIADMSQNDLTSAPQPAFIVVDLESGEAKRVAQGHKALMPEIEGGLALNPITIDKDYEWVYFGALNGRTIYRVPASSFDGDASTVTQTIEEHSKKSFSDGMTIDDAGNIYVADIEANAIGLSTPEGFRTIGNLPDGQSWPDGFAFSPDGYLYVTVNQLNRAPALNKGVEKGTGEYLILRFKPLAPGSVGR
ncbi:L-dopachrome tautomerase-related protein [Roseibium sp. HPY-6]|uniref:SMP-30/gluconolactonase/LRE family protein n=1 Tax=Roseibium sp. HPY-6 TaxID=3229852 RepID=UPI0033905559